MASPEEREAELKEVSELLAELASLDAKDLARTDELARDINFEDAVPYFEPMLEVARQLNQRDLERLPMPALQALKGGCAQLKALVDRVNAFSLTSEANPSSVCSGLINEVKAAYDTVVNPFLLPLSFTATQATDYAKIEREAKGYHTTMKEQSDQLLKDLGTIRRDAEKALQAVREQAAQAGVSTNAEIFLEESRVHEQAARKWFWGTAAAAAATVVAAFLFVVGALQSRGDTTEHATPASTATATESVDQPPSTAQSVQEALTRLVFLSALSFGMFWCARNYRAERHNATLNRHRANALRTFRAFVEGTGDERVRDAILLQASQAAFANRPTGYESREAERQTVNPVVEVLGKVPRGGSSE